MDYTNKAIILTATDVLVDKDAAYLAVLPEIICEVLGGEHTVSQSFIRNQYLTKSLRSILEDYLSIEAEDCELRDPVADICYRLNVDTSSFSYNEYGPALDKALKPYQEKMDQAIGDFYMRKSPLIPGAMEAIDVLSKTGCQIRFLDVLNDRPHIKFDLAGRIAENTNVAYNKIAPFSLSDLEKCDIKDIFPELENFESSDILLCSNKQPLLRNAIRTGSVERVRGLRGTFYDGACPDREQRFRMKSKPYHIMMVGYNQSVTDKFKPEGVAHNRVFSAQGPAQLLSRCQMFLDGQIAQSFIPKVSKPRPTVFGGASILEFPISREP